MKQQEAKGEGQRLTMTYLKTVQLSWAFSNFTLRDKAFQQLTL